MKRLLFIISSLFIIQSCAKPYYGYSEEQWNKLSSLERESIKSEYKTILDSKQSQDHDNIINARDQSIKDFAKEGFIRR